MTKTLKKKQIILAALLLAANIQVFAQGNGMAGINEATSMVTSYFDPGTKLIYAIGAVVGLIGGIKVYGKFSSGDPDTSKTAATGASRYMASSHRATPTPRRPPRAGSGRASS